MNKYFFIASMESYNQVYANILSSHLKYLHGVW